eukprot:TRINITY_DN58799_c0_g1_i1.p1 TRINITY_DN58799_c0_g1~~TRINITY_DN58799_c0_g1_i1.p1  ORF type:complete len:318 (+),score=46.99 TRINITY_DN58799_c0_g1_i1:74-1027(+)
MKRKAAEFQESCGSWPKSKGDVRCIDLSSMLQDIEGALANSKNVPLKHITPATFTISAELRNCLNDALFEAQHGSGVVFLRLPPEWISKQGEDLCQRAFCGLCSHLGRAVTQSTDLGEICARVEVARSPEVLAAKHTKRRGYRNSKDQFLHVDSSIPAARGTGACDILAMLCIRPAIKGGISKMASAAAIFEQLEQKHKELLATLETGFRYDAGAVEYHPDWRQAPQGDQERPMVYKDAAGRPCVQYAKNMVETIAAEYAKTGQESEVKRALNKLEEVCSDAAVVQYWHVQAGEIYLIDNYRWMHARTEFEDDPAAR